MKNFLVALLMLRVWFPDGKSGIVVGYVMGNRGINQQIMVVFRGDVDGKISHDYIEKVVSSKWVEPSADWRPEVKP